MAAIATHHPFQSIVLSALLCFFLSFLINSPGCKADDRNILYTNEVLRSGDYLQYEKDRFLMQEDCNLVLYRKGSPIWASNSGGLAKNCYCKMQSDGNLVVYETRSGRPIWASNSGRGEDNYVLILQKDGNVVIYGGALFATGTNRGSGAMTWIRKIKSAEPKGTS